MKTFALLPALVAIAALSCAPALADPPRPKSGIKATTTLHPDGTRTDLIRDLDAATAESKTLDAAGKLLQRSTFKLDENGEPIEGIVYNAKGQASYKFVYNRNTSGLISEELDMSADGKLLRKLIYRYGSTGQIAGIDAFDAEGNPLKSASTGGSPGRKDVKKKKSR